LFLGISNGRPHKVNSNTPFTLKRHPNQAQFSRSIALGIEETYLGIQHSFIENQRCMVFWRLAWHDFSDIYCKKNSTLCLLRPQAGNHDSLSLINWKLSKCNGNWTWSRLFHPAMASVSANTGRMVGEHLPKIRLAH